MKRSSLVLTASAFVALAAAGPSRAELPRAAAKVVDYSIEVRLDTESHELEGRQRLVWRNPSGDAVPDLWFHLYLNAYRNNRSTFYVESGGKLRDDTAPADGWGWIDVTEMKLADGTDLLPALTFEHPDDDNDEDRTVARVGLPSPVAPGAELALDIAFTARLPKLYARSGYKDDFYAVAQWFPKLAVYEPAGLRGRAQGGWNCHQYHANSEFYADYGDYRVEITLPARFVVGATGARVERRENADGTVTHVHAQSDIHDFVWTADPGFVELRETFSAERDVSKADLAETARLLGRSADELRLRDVEIRLLLQPSHRAQAARHFAAAKFGLKWLGLWYGAYPYPTLTVVDPPIDAGGAYGVEYPTLIFAGTRYSYKYWPFSGFREPEIVTLHEFAHQYWYGLVGSNEFEEAWLDEGFTTYSTAKAMDLGYGSEASIVDILGFELNGLEADRISNRHDRRTDRIATPSWQFSRGQYGFNSYARTALVLDTMEGILGRETMARVLRTYHERFRYGHPRGEDFFAVAEEVSGRDLDWYFEQVVLGAGVFDPAIDRISTAPVEAFRGRVEREGEPLVVSEEEAARDEDAADEAATRRWRSVVELRHLGEVQLPVEVELVFEGQEPEVRIWEGERRWERWTIERDERLLSARIDPQGKLALDAARLNNARRVDAEPRAARSLSARLLHWLQSALAWMAL